MLAGRILFSPQLRASVTISMTCSRAQRMRWNTASLLIRADSQSGCLRQVCAGAFRPTCQSWGCAFNFLRRTSTFSNCSYLLFALERLENRKTSGVLLTFEAVSSIMVHFSSTALAAAIRAFFFSSFKSYRFTKQPALSRAFGPSKEQPVVDRAVPDTQTHTHARVRDSTATFTHA